MSLTIRLQGQLRSGKNRVLITRTGHRYPPPQFVAFRKSIVDQIAAQVGNIATLTEPQKVTIRYTPGDLIRRDAPGIIDALWHCLEYAGVIADDALLQAIDYRQEPVDRANPHAILTLERL